MNYRALILDLDGTVYVDGKPIKDVVTKLNNYKKTGNRIIYLSNNTTVGRSVYYEKLTKLGLNMTDGQVVTPITIAGPFLRKRHTKGFMVATNSFIDEMADSFGILNEEVNPEFVLVAFDNEVTYEKLKIACEHINSGVPYYITHIDLACPSEKGPIPDCGALALLIEKVTNKKHIMDFGKPSDEMAACILGLLKDVPKSQILLGGDRLYTDISLGNKLGVRTLLVLTGESDLGDIQLPENTGYHVDYCANNLADFLDNHVLNRGIEKMV